MKSEPRIRAALPEGLTPAILREMYAKMVLTRQCDDRAFALNRQGKIPFAATCQGHEAVQAGAAFAVRRGTDWIVPYYRDTCLALSAGVTAKEQLMCLFARKGDIFSSGRQFPNHYSVPDRNIASISSIIAAHVTHGVGMALAFKMRKEPAVVLITFGEGSTSEGEWHEALNFAAVQRVPVVFVCENNRWAISTPQVKQMVNQDVAARARGYGLPSVVVDGFDPVAVYEGVAAARETAARGGGATLIEAKCYRFLSHTTDDDDKTYRTREEVEAQRKLDPVPRFERRLLELGVLSQAQLDALRSEITATVNATTDDVEREALPERADLYGNVWEGPDSPWV